MIIILKLKNAPAVLRLRRRLRTHAWLAVCWFLLIFPLPGMCLVVSQNSSSKSSSLYEDEVCLLSRTSSLKEACQGSLSDTGEHLTWVSLIKMTRDCAIDYPLNENQSQSADDAYGLFWHIGTETEFDSFLEQFNNNTGLRVGGRSRSIGEYIRSWLDVWPTPAIPGPHDYWFISAEVFGESIGSRDVFLDLTRLLINDADYRLTDIPAVFRDAGSAAYAGSYSALPLWLTSYQLLYRRDVFEAHNIAVPHTWDAALEIANQYGKGALGPGQPDLGFCFEANPAARPQPRHLVRSHEHGSHVRQSGGAWRGVAVVHGSEGAQCAGQQPLLCGVRHAGQRALSHAVGLLLCVQGALGLGPGWDENNPHVLKMHLLT
ncbi:hypothetical protein Vretimale_2319 [Volvox reticuliferus]|nr:hypothetical protein Vretimale_2319 [Volvox reticuliferus]